jgi:hypothetical protein
MFARWLNMARLAAEANEVIGLRLAKLALGGSDALDEAFMMVAEKVAAGQRAAGSLMTGASPDSVVTGYREAVQANARRLSRR